MGPPPLPLEHLTRPPTRGSPGRSPLLVLLHGYGSNEKDLMSVAPSVDPRFFVVSARAPITLGQGTYGWFPIGTLPFGIEVDPNVVDASRRTLLAFVDHLVERHDLDPARVYLAGFSQGAMIAVSASLLDPGKVAGVAALSGLYTPEMLPVPAPDGVRGLPMLVTHGVGDPLIPVLAARLGRRLLEGVGVDLTYREYPDGHYVGGKALADVAAWLSARLDGVKS